MNLKLTILTSLFAVNILFAQEQRVTNFSDSIVFKSSEKSDGFLQNESLDTIAFRTDSIFTIWTDPLEFFYKSYDRARAFRGMGKFDFPFRKRECTIQKLDSMIQQSSSNLEITIIEFVRDRFFITDSAFIKEHEWRQRAQQLMLKNAEEDKNVLTIQGARESIDVESRHLASVNVIDSTNYTQLGIPCIDSVRNRIDSIFNIGYPTTGTFRLRSYDSNLRLRLQANFTLCNDDSTYVVKNLVPKLKEQINKGGKWNVDYSSFNCFNQHDELIHNAWPKICSCDPAYKMDTRKGQPRRRMP